MELTVRPMTPGDRETAFDISSRVWGGWDYVKQFYDGWVERGGFWGVEVAGRLAGFGKATELAPGEWWLEGLRVDPDRQGEGIGTRLSEAILGKTLELKPRTLRLATAEVNRHSIAIIRRMGFGELFRTRLYKGVPRPPDEGAALFTPSVGQTRRYLEAEPELAAKRGLLSYTWLFREATDEYISELVEAGMVYGCGNGGRLDGLLIARPHRYWPTDVEVTLLGGTEPAVRSLSAYLMGKAVLGRSERLSGMASSEGMKRALSEIGMEPHPRLGETIVYEYPLG